MSEKRERLINPDMYSDIDDRGFKEQMNDLGVEVVERQKVDPHGIVWVGPKENLAKKGELLQEAAALIKAAGLEGYISPAKVLEVPKEQIEALLEEGMSSAKMAEILGISVSAVSQLRKLYGITGRPRRRNRTAEAPKEKQKEKEKEKAEVPEEAVLLSVKTIRTNAQAAGGEVLGTAKMLEKLGDLPVIVEIRVMEDLQL